MTGQSLVEILLALGVTALVLPAILTGFVAAREGKAQQEQRSYAVGWAREAGEAVRSVRDAGWSGVAANGVYYPAVAGGQWTLVAGIEAAQGYTRAVEIADGRRDGGGNLVETGGSVDPSVKKVTVTVGWGTILPTVVANTFYLTRYRDNLAYTQTTESEFNAGIKAGTAVTNTAGGEVTLGAGGHGDWCAPNLAITALDLPKSGVANAVSAIEGRAFAGTGDNSSGVSFANVVISNGDPPVASVAGTFDGFKTNAVFGEAGYAYLATDNNSHEVEIIDLTSTSYTEEGYFNPPSNKDGNGVFAVGNVGYMTTGNVLYSFDLTSKSGSRPMVDSLEVTTGGVARKLYIVGNYAYIAIDGYPPKELAIVDIGNPANLQEVGYADVDSAGGKEVHVNSTGTRAYLATSADSSKREFFIVDVSVKTGARPVVGSYDALGMSPRGVAVVPGNKAILVGEGGEEYQVINIVSEVSPVRCGGLEIDTGVRGIAAVLEQDGDAYSYIVTGDAAAEFKIIEGGPGGQYASAGTFESSVFGPGYQTAFNRMGLTAVVPNQTETKYQVAVADAVGGSCAGVAFSFVGPDGTSGTFFGSDGGAVPTNNDGLGFENPGQCMRYKLYLSTADAASTPEVHDVTVNYSP